MADKPKASPTQIRAFFETGTADKVGARELMALKKGPDGVAIPDYDQIAIGIADGSLTY
jgi:hypothetical protein